MAAKYDWSDLYKLYIVQSLSGKEIAKIKCCKPGIVYDALRKRNIATRPLSVAAKLGFQKERRVNPAIFKKGERSAFWKGGRYISNKGYVYIFLPDHPMANKAGYVAEHRLVMSNKLGRVLLPSEHVHHRGTKYPINDIKNKSDNREANLDLLSPTNHNLKEQFCRHCPIGARIRLLEWQIKNLQDQIQGKLVLEEHLNP
jgi:hypothetical protein